MDAAAWAAAVPRWGGPVYGPNHPGASLSLEQAGRAYRRAYLGERSVGRLTGRPLSRTPMSVQRDDHATGRIRLFSIAWRGLTRLECGGRRPWAAAGPTWAGLSAGTPNRATARPTAKRLLEALEDIPLTSVTGPQQTDRSVTALRPLHQRLLGIVGGGVRARYQALSHCCCTAFKMGGPQALLHNVGFSFHKARLVSNHLDAAKRLAWMEEKWPAISRAAKRRQGLILFAEEASYAQ